MGYFVYKYVYNEEIIYVGKTDSSLIGRIKNHANEEKFQKYKNAEIYYIELSNSAETKAVEALLINKYKPRLNIVDKYDSISPFLKFDEPEWIRAKAIISNFSDEAFAVYCSIREIIKIENNTKIFVTYNRIAYELLGRKPTRKEHEAIKSGFSELCNISKLKILYSLSKSEFVVETSNILKTNDELFLKATIKETQEIMNIESKNDKFKLFRYFSYLINSFDETDDIDLYGKISSVPMSYFESEMSISKPTIVAFNRILEEKHLIFIIRHKDFQERKTNFVNGIIGENINTYSRWEDKELAIEFSEKTYGYKYIEKNKNIISDAANKNRSLGQKLNNYIYNHTEYDDVTITEMREYAEKKNTRLKEKYEDEISKGYHPEEPVYIDMTVFGAVG